MKVPSAMFHSLVSFWSPRGCLTNRFFHLSSTLQEPFDFQNNFKIDALTGSDILALKRLERLNPHPEDVKLEFNEERHEYLYEGNLMSTSVTSLIAQYFEKFEADKVVKNMIQGKNWPRAEYTHMNGQPFTAEEIKRQWEDGGLFARNRGTWMHYNIERYLNGLSTSVDIPELEQFIAFHDEVIRSQNLVPYRTEWRIVAPDLSLAGSVDLVVRREDGSYTIIDWKRSKHVPTRLTTSYGKYGRRPLQHMPDCDGSKYFLQLNLYRYILQHYYRLRISSMMVVSMHPDFQSYCSVSVPVLDEEIDQLVAHRKSLRS